MNRIKFRAWDKRESRMVENVGISETQFVKGEQLHVSAKDPNFILMQASGFADVHGVEVYEGDIIEMRHQHLRTPIRNVVEYLEGILCVGHTDDPLHYWINTLGAEVRVIGNKYKPLDTKEKQV